MCILRIAARLGEIGNLCVTCFAKLSPSKLLVITCWLNLSIHLPKFRKSNCDRILENSSKSHMKSSVFLHVFNDISIYA